MTVGPSVNGVHDKFNLINLKNFLIFKSKGQRDRRTVHETPGHRWYNLSSLDPLLPVL